MRIAVAGGTGVVGRHVVAAVERTGHVPVVLARSRGVDLVTGQGVAGSLAGVDAVIDVTNITTASRSKSVTYFTAACENLLGEATRAGVRHHVVLSIVGVDRVHLGYYEGKLRQEELALTSAVPTTVLRSTQFHEFADQMLTRIRGPIAVLPKQRIRPVAAAEVAEELVSIAAGEARGLGPQIAGPDEHHLVDMARRVAQRRGQRRLVAGVHLPGRAGRQMADGSLLPAGWFRQGGVAFDTWLDRSIGSARS